MSYQLVDNIRGKVLQEFATKAEAEKAFNHQSSEADLSIVEPVKKTTPKKKVANVKKESN
jgi:hypothetical protein|tara:strand:- start:134 stop:313 length:180 start_codon:yes stop_codon:yes gene_type:complete